jgi:hypothetical protein
VRRWAYLSALGALFVALKVDRCWGGNHAMQLVMSKYCGNSLSGNNDLDFVFDNEWEGPGCGTDQEQLHL